MCSCKDLLRFILVLVTISTAVQSIDPLITEPYGDGPTFHHTKGDYADGPITSVPGYPAYGQLSPPQYFVERQQLRNSELAYFLPEFMRFMESMMIIMSNTPRSSGPSSYNYKETSASQSSSFHKSENTVATIPYPNPTYAFLNAEKDRELNQGGSGPNFQKSEKIVTTAPKPNPNPSYEFLNAETNREWNEKGSAGQVNQGQQQYQSQYLTNNPSSYNSWYTGNPAGQNSGLGPQYFKLKQDENIETTDEGDVNHTLKSLTQAKDLNKYCVFQGISPISMQECDKYLVCLPARFNRFNAYIAECPTDKKFSMIYRRCVQPYLVPECSGYPIIRPDKALPSRKDESEDPNSQFEIFPPPKFQKKKYEKPLYRPTKDTTTNSTTLNEVPDASTSLEYPFNKTSAYQVGQNYSDSNSSVYASVTPAPTTSTPIDELISTTTYQSVSTEGSTSTTETQTARTEESTTIEISTTTEDDLPTTEDDISASSTTESSTTTEANISTSSTTEGDILTSSTTEADISASSTTESSTTTEANISTSSTTEGDISTSSTTERDISTIWTTERDISTSSTTEGDISTSSTTEADISTTEGDISTSSTTEADISTSSPTEGDISTSSTTEADISMSSTTEADISTSSTTEADISTSSTTEADISMSSTTEDDLSASSTTESSPSSTTTEVDISTSSTTELFTTTTDDFTIGPYYSSTTEDSKSSTVGPVHGRSDNVDADDESSTSTPDSSTPDANKETSFDADEYPSYEDSHDRDHSFDRVGDVIMDTPYSFPPDSKTDSNPVRRSVRQINNHSWRKQ